MTSIFLTWRQCARVGAVCAMVLSLAVAVRGQLSMGPNQIGRQLLTGPNPEEDPNFPGASGKVTIANSGGDVTWTKHQGIVLDWHQAGDPDFGVNIPQVLLSSLPNGMPTAWADYLGFIDGMGSLLEVGTKGGIYVFNASASTLTKKYDTIDQVPEDVLTALKNRKYIYESSRDALSVVTAAMAEANNSAPPTAAKPYEVDPNLAGAVQDNYPLTWDENRTSFTVKLPQMQPVPAMYMGFNERGSWIASALGRLYLWNLASKTLVEVSDSWWDAPLDLRNPSVLTQAMIYYRQHQYRAAAGQKQSPDPNIPPNMSEGARLYLAVIWEFQGNDMTRPLVFLGAGSADVYLGFDERGSWIQSQHGGIYVWSFRTWKLERLASRLSNIPYEALVRVHNTNGLVKQPAAGLPIPVRP